MNQGEDVQQERDEIEHYLRTLRKKVDHQIKNPFELAFANYSFEQLASWKTNVLQLDATSKLYGQRVDFLHCGAMHILGSVLNQDIPPPQNNKHQPKKEHIYDNHPHQSHLQEPHKLNAEIVTIDNNILLWREVTKKRDALHQLMMNELEVDHELRLGFFGNYGGEWESVDRVGRGDEELGVYLKLLDFKRLTLNALGIYKQIEEQVSDTNVFMINFTGRTKERSQQVKIEQFLNFDFQCLQREFLPQPFSCIEAQNMVQRHQLSPILVQQEQENKCSEQQEQSEYSFQLQNWNKTEKISKVYRNKKLRKTRRKDGDQKQKVEEMIHFKGIHPQRSEVFQIQGEGEQEKFLCPRDYLLTKFIKYPPMFAKNKKQKRAGRQRYKNKGSLTQRSQSQFQSLHPYDPPPNQLQSIPQESFQPQGDTHMRSILQNPLKQHFKEAALPIKQMKKKIKQRATQSQLAFRQIKTIFSKEQPLDIFISILHVAAEQQIMISL